MNTQNTIEDSLSGDYLYAQVTELIGELSWGIELPTVVNVGIIDPLTKEVQRIAVSGTSQKPYFAAIYDKVRANIKYNPLKTERDKVYRLEQQNAELLAALIDIACFNRFLLVPLHSRLVKLPEKLCNWISAFHQYLTFNHCVNCIKVH